MSIVSVNEGEGTVKEKKKDLQSVWIGPTRNSPIEARASHSDLARTMSPRCRATGGEVSDSVSESESEDMIEA